MMHPTVDFKNFLKPGVRVHLSGIGGVSMCPLAEVRMAWAFACRDRICRTAIL